MDDLGVPLFLETPKWHTGYSNDWSSYLWKSDAFGLGIYLGLFSNLKQRPFLLFLIIFELDHLPPRITSRKHLLKHTVDGTNPASIEVFLHPRNPRWLFGISSINSITLKFFEQKNFGCLRVQSFSWDLNIPLCSILVYSKWSFVVGQFGSLVDFGNFLLWGEHLNIHMPGLAREYVTYVGVWNH